MSVQSDGPVQQEVIRVPQHQHPLTSKNPLMIYKIYKGNWQCDNCGSKHGPGQYPFNCSECSYDICQPCGNGVMLNEVHNHKLFDVNVSQLQNQNWTCTVCKTNGRQTHVLHCSPCGFYMCRSCSTELQHLIHTHPLKIVSTDIIYPHTSGNWGCDICGRVSRFNERYARHCSAACEFDVCNSCIKEYHTSRHPHPLVRIDPDIVYARFSGNWGCDSCGRVSTNPLMNKYPWHCTQCEFDMCNNCMQGSNSDLNLQLDVTGPPPGPRNIAMISPHLERLNHQQDEPMEPACVSEEGRVVTSTEAHDGDECIICLENPKNATLIHGDTGHLCCCWSCAQVLRKRGDTCPICRQCIDHVIKQFKA